MRKGIILAGGQGSRLFPVTKAVCKQLLPIYNKPMIYYPLTTLIQAAIKDILIITNPSDLNSFKEMLGDGSNLGLNLQYIAQPNPGGIAQAFLLGEEFIDNHPVCLILGDNIFHGNIPILSLERGSILYTYQVKDPERYGVLESDKVGNPIEIVEKPKNPKTNCAVTGLYFYDEQVVDMAKKLKPSSRGELEITDLNRLYIKQKNTTIIPLEAGTAWLDTGTFESLMQASQYVEAVESRTGSKIGSIHEATWKMGNISDEQLKIHAESFNTDYGQYLFQLLEQ